MEIVATAEEADKALKALTLPFRPFYRLVISFAHSDRLHLDCPPTVAVKLRASVPFDDFLRGLAEGVTAPRRDDARNIATHPLRAHVEEHLQAKGLKI
nr:hypothetical protein [Rhizobium leguminosarum]